jgi:hypothetical protein
MQPVIGDVDVGNEAIVEGSGSQGAGAIEMGSASFAGVVEVRKGAEGLKRALLCCTEAIEAGADKSALGAINRPLRGCTSGADKSALGAINRPLRGCAVGADESAGDGFRRSALAGAWG